MNSTLQTQEQENAYRPLQGLAAYLRAEGWQVDSQVDDKLPGEALRRWADEVDCAAQEVRAPAFTLHGYVRDDGIFSRTPFERRPLDNWTSVFIARGTWNEVPDTTA